jgi:hypothetical protein
MKFSTRIQRVFAIFLAALFLTWPALLNRYPLLYPDSIGYLQDGRSVAAALFLHRSGVNAMRSEFFSLGIFPFHWNLTPWPVVALQALLTAWVLWLVVRSVVQASTEKRHLMAFLTLTALLSVFTSVSWFVSLLMPDILGALLYLAIYLLVFAREAVSRLERFGLSVLAFWAITAHATHLMLATGLCLLLGMLLAVRWRPIAGRGRAVAKIAGLVALATGAQVALHAYLYKQASLSGNHPPYLMARIVADGPGATYLRQHCPTPAPPLRAWAICAYAGNLPDNDDDFLWGESGIWSSADAQTQRRLLAEEMPLVLATVRAYPGRQIAVSWGNFLHQLNDFGVNDFDNNDWMQTALEGAFPGSRDQYQTTLQARSIVPSNRFTLIQCWVVWPSVLLLAVLLPKLIRDRRDKPIGLAVIVGPVLLANAFVTAVLSSSDSRYQARVVWLIPLLAWLAVSDILANRNKGRGLAELPAR